MRKIYVVLFVLLINTGLKGRISEFSKEQVIKNFNSILFTGTDMTFEWGETINTAFMSDDGKDISISAYSKTGRLHLYNFTGIVWESLDTTDFSSKNSYCNISLRFTKLFYRKDELLGYPEANSRESALSLSISPNYIEDFKKYCIRLSEIYKEENCTLRK